jgi:heme-degrading monooxygenase HmoA
MSAVLAIFTVDGDPETLLAAYDRAMPAIQAGAAEYGSPRMHACAATDTGITIVDVWESADAFGRFAEHPEFARARRDAGLPDPTTVQVWPVHAADWPSYAEA